MHLNELINFLINQFRSLGLIIQKHTNSNRITVFDSNSNPIKEYYYKLWQSNSGGGFWGPRKAIIDNLISQFQSKKVKCTLLLATNTKVYILNENDITLIPANFKLNSNKQYLIFEKDLINKINPKFYNL